MVLIIGSLQEKLSKTIIKALESTIDRNMRIAKDLANKCNTVKMKGILVDCMGGYVEVKRKGGVYPDSIDYNDKNFEDLVKRAIEKREHKP